MTDPQPDRLGRKPTRAEPLQPDAPTQGSEPDADTSRDPQSADAQASTDADKAAEHDHRRAVEQADTAVRNNEQGFD